MPPWDAWLEQKLGQLNSGEFRYNEDDNRPPKPKGSIVGAAALIAGAAVGGGILAVPAVTSPVGFVPSTLTMIVVWAFCCSQALLLAEVNLAIMSKRGVTSTSMLGMASTTLGRPAGYAVGVMYFLFSNALLVAQLSRGGELLTSGLGTTAAYAPTVGLIAVACYALTLVDGGRVGELTNRYLTGMIIATFLVLVAYGLTHMTFAPLLATAQWDAASSIVPYMLQVLNFMNMIPLVCSFLGGSRSRVRKAIITGSLIPLVVVVIWNGVMVGLSDMLGTTGVADPVNALLNNGTPWLSAATYLFAACAVLTSVLGTYLALEEFVYEALDREPQVEPQGDACQLYPDEFRVYPDQPKPKGARQGTFDLQAAIPDMQAKAITFLPSVLVAALSPSAFYSAMNISGTYFVPAVFCVAPPFMAWLVRYQRAPWPFQSQKWNGKPAKQMVPGGKPVLTLFVALSLGVMSFSDCTVRAALWGFEAE